MRRCLLGMNLDENNLVAGDECTEVSVRVFKRVMRFRVRMKGPKKLKRLSLADNIYDLAHTSSGITNINSLTRVRTVVFLPMLAGHASGYTTNPRFAV